MVTFIVTSDTTGASWRRSQPLGNANDADWSWAEAGQINNPSFALYTNDPAPHTVLTYVDRNSVGEDELREKLASGGTSILGSIPTNWVAISCLSDLDEAEIFKLIKDLSLIHI